MDIAPGTKDWTWVLARPCPECGVDTRQVRPEGVAPLLGADAAAWAELLAPESEPQRRPKPDKWSRLEYACHVRHVFHFYHERLRLMLTADDPVFPNGDQDETVRKQLIHHLHDVRG